MHRSIASLALWGLLMSAGCSTFPRDYRAAAVKRDAPASIDGAWVGTWSGDDGHQGALRCILTAVPGNAQAAPTTQPVLPIRYAARFEATFWKIFTGYFTTVLTGTRQGDVTHLSGDDDLGFLLGRYHYEATVTPARFDATYQAKGERGEFRLTRPNADGGGE